MPMPTTRRGRYLLYRARALKRLRRAENRRFRPLSSTGKKSGHATSRGLDYLGYTKQEPREYPLPPALMWPPGWWGWAWAVRPDRGVWGVLIDLTPAPGPFGPWGHLRFEWVGYHKRRVKSLPPLKHIPKLGYKLPASAITPFEFYPWPTYPSGQHNPRAWLP